MAGVLSALIGLSIASERAGSKDAQHFFMGIVKTPGLGCGASSCRARRGCSNETDV
jgi:hypothetical protein